MSTCLHYFVLPEDIPPAGPCPVCGGNIPTRQEKVVEVESKKCQCDCSLCMCDKCRSNRCNECTNCSCSCDKKANQ